VQARLQTVARTRPGKTAAQARACAPPPESPHDCEPVDAQRVGDASDIGSGGAPVLGVPCCQKAANPVVPSPVPVL
jgi:hypothetical protein